MFETLFTYPRVLRRHREAPLAEERAAYHLQTRPALAGTRTSDISPANPTHNRTARVNLMSVSLRATPRGRPRPGGVSGRERGARSPLCAADQKAMRNPTFTKWSSRDLSPKRPE